MAVMHIEYGVFPEQIPYARWGAGQKIMLIFAGGPGNAVPQGMGLRFMTRPFNAFASEYTIYYLTRRYGQPAGFTTRDMSEDYARLIDREFDGQVDVIAALSCGGLIAQHLAVDHPACFGRMIILASGCRVSDPGKEIDSDHAKYLNQGKKGKAMSSVMNALYPPGFLRSVMKIASWVVGALFFKEGHSDFQNDVMIEAEAECAHDTAERLAVLTVPVLLICGTEDIYFPRPIIEETARCMGDHGILKLYEGRGHGNILEDKRLVPDIEAFIAEA